MNINPFNSLSPVFRDGCRGAHICIGANVYKDERAPQSATEQEAHAIGVNACLYFYPLISTDITRLTSANIGAGKEPLNTFVSAAAYPPGDLKLVVPDQFRHAVLFGVAGPHQGTHGRFCARYQWALLSPADARYVDRRFRLSRLENTGTQAQNFLIIPRGWRPDLRDKVIEDFKLPKDIQRIDARPPTS
jgi:hypothetical protein